MKKIIVPIDFSECSENALKSAVHIAKKNNAEVVIVHMLGMEDGTYTRTENYLEKEYIFKMKLAEKNIAEFLAKDYLVDVKISSIVKQHTMFDELNEITSAEKADFVVMGSKGASGFREALVGSNTEKVVRNSVTPVLVVRDEFNTNDSIKVVFACNFKDEDLKSYRKSTEFSNQMGWELKFLYVNTPGSNFMSTEEQKKHVAEFLYKAGVEKSQIEKVVFISSHSVEEGIFEYVKSSDTDVIAIATHGRKGLDHLLNGSLSEDVVNHASFPVMTFKI